MFEMQELDILTEFDEKLWLTVIDTVTVHTDGRMRFKFQGGTEIEALSPNKNEKTAGFNACGLFCIKVSHFAARGLL